MLKLKQWNPDGSPTDLSLIADNIDGVEKMSDRTRVHMTEGNVFDVCETWDEVNAAWQAALNA